MKNLRRIITAALFAGIATTAFAQDSSTVKLLIVARDRSGKIVQDLKPEDLIVLDNGRPAKILGLEFASNIPLRVGILLLAEASTFRVQQEAAMQLLGSLRPGIDQSFVVTRATSTQHRPWRTQNLKWEDSRVVISFLDTLRWSESVDFATDAVMTMLELNANDQFRSIMIEFRDPDMEVGNYTLMVQTDQILRREISDYQRYKTLVYTSTIQTRMRRQPGYEPGSVQIERVAVSTGGRYLQFDKLKSKIPELIEDLQNQRLLTFVSQPVQRSHTLEIRVNRKDVRISCSKQFFPDTAAKQ